MKKIFKISALLLLLPMVATSCFKLEQDDIFDKSAAVRLDEAADNFAQVLLDKGGVWQMEYYANEGMQGYVYVMKFYDNGNVDIPGHNPYIGAVDKGNGSTEVKYGKATSQWDMITDNGPVLSFSSYNKYFHVFSRPDDILNTGNGVGNDGRGFEGDYEFTVLKYSGDTLYVQGKKYNIPMLMTRLPADTNDQEYLQTVVDNWSKYFSPLIPRVFLTYPNGKRYVIQDGSGLIMTLYEESRDDDPDYDPLVNTFTRNGIIGHDAFGFMNPLEYDGFNVQHFVPQEDGTLLCTDDNTSTISAGDLAKDCFTDTLHASQEPAQGRHPRGTRGCQAGREGREAQRGRGAHHLLGNQPVAVDRSREGRPRRAQQPAAQARQLQADCRLGEVQLHGLPHGELSGDYRHQDLAVEHAVVEVLLRARVHRPERYRVQINRERRSGSHAGLLRQRSLQRHEAPHRGHHAVVQDQHALDARSHAHGLHLHRQCRRCDGAQRETLELSINSDCDAGARNPVSRHSNNQKQIF